ncbi:hypothetical protein THIX_60091 [Thiomonas sp. X19]|nr:hypothetical protein THIX_60091 [Thiomonas sp. X19]
MGRRWRSRVCFADRGFLSLGEWLQSLAQCDQSGPIGSFCASIILLFLVVFLLGVAVYWVATVAHAVKEIRAITSGD